MVVSPQKRRYEALLEEDPLTSLEDRLQKVLAKSKGRDTSRKTMMVGMQAATVLQNVYVGRVQERLQAQDGKTKQKKRKLLGDGLLRLMDGEEFYSQVKDTEAAQEIERVEKSARKAEKERYDAQMDAWKAKEEARKQRVTVQRQQYHDALAEWERERAVAKQEHRRSGLVKPLLGKIEPALLKPRLSALGQRAEEDRGDELEEDENNIDACCNRKLIR